MLASHRAVLIFWKCVWLMVCIVLLPSALKAQSTVFPEWTARFDAAHLGDAPRAIAADSQGNTYVIGLACLGAAPCADQEVVTIKYDSDGHVQWKAWLSSPNRAAQPVGVAVDAAGNAYILAAAFLFNQDHTLLSPEFVTAKYSPAGVRLWICAVHEIVRDDVPWKIAVSPDGNVYVTGTSSPNVFIPNIGFTPDLLTIKYDTNGNELWTRRRPVFNEFESLAVAGTALDSQENLYIAANGHQAGVPDGFILKYDQNGNKLAEFKGLVAFNTVFHVDAQGNSYVGGTAEPFPQSSPGGSAIEKFDSNGSLVWQLGGGTSVSFEGISSDSFGQTYAAVDANDLAGHRIGTLEKLTADVGEPIWGGNHVFPGGPFSGSPAILAVDQFGDLYVASRGTVAKYRSDGLQIWVQQFTGTTQGLTLGGDDGLFVAGSTPGIGGGANTSDWITIDYVQDGAKVTPTAITFGNQKVGTQSAVQCVTLADTVARVTESQVNIASIRTSGDFQQTNNCPLTLLIANQSCLIHVIFLPTATGTRTGTLTISDQWEGSPRVVKLSGTGVQ